MNKRPVYQYILFTLIVGILVSLFSSFINPFLSRYGNQFNLITCKLVWSLENETFQRLFYQLCISTKDNHLDNQEIYSFIDSIQKALKSPYNDMFVEDKTIRDKRIEYSTGYAIDSYISKIRPEKFVRKDDKPNNYFEDVYEPNKYNEEQKVLLEQAQYIEFEKNNSKAQSILGPQRELKYVGLHFPYGLNLQPDVD